MFWVNFLKILSLAIPLPSLPHSIEWLKLRSVLTTIPVPQPMTSNPQPKPYRYSPILNFSPVRPKSRYVSIQENRAFRKASYDDTNLTKSPEIRHFSAFIYLFSTEGKLSQHDKCSGKDPHTQSVLPDILFPAEVPDLLPGWSACRQYKPFFPHQNQ